MRTTRLPTIRVGVSTEGWVSNVPYPGRGGYTYPPASPDLWYTRPCSLVYPFWNTHPLWYTYPLWYTQLPSIPPHPSPGTSTPLVYPPHTLYIPTPTPLNISTPRRDLVPGIPNPEQIDRSLWKLRWRMLILKPRAIVNLYNKSSSFQNNIVDVLSVCQLITSSVVLSLLGSSSASESHVSTMIFIPVVVTTSFLFVTCICLFSPVPFSTLSSTFTSFVSSVVLSVQ